VKKTFALATLLVLSTLPAYAWTTFSPPTPAYGQPQIQTRPNIFGGYTIDQGFGRPRIETRPNVFGGVNCR